MAKISTGATEQASAAVESASNVSPIENPVVSGNAIENMARASTVAAPSAESVDVAQTVQQVHQAQPSQQVQTRQQVENMQTVRPRTVVADVAKTMGIAGTQSNQSQPVPYSPLQNLPTSRQVSNDIASQQEASQIRREALADNAMEQQASEQVSEDRRVQQVPEQSVQQEEPARDNEQVQAAPQKPAVQERVESKLKRNDETVASTTGPGIADKQKTVNPSGYINKIFSGARKRITSAASNVIKTFNPAGNSFNAVMLGDANVQPHCVSIGSENLIEAIREPGSKIIDLVNEKTGLSLDVQSCLDDISLLVNAINSADIEAVLEKSPDNRRDSIQVRTLRAHMGVNIRIHPTQLKGFNADFDGDEGKLMLDQRLLGRYERAMSLLVGIDGKPNIDPDFFPLDPLADASRSAVLDLMIEKDFAWNDLIARAIVDKYITVANNQTQQNWVALLRAIDDSVYRMSNDPKRRQALVSRTFGSLYNFSRRRRLLDFMANSDMLNLSEEYSNFDPPAPGTDPFVMVMVNVVDEAIAGRQAPNMQDFARMYSRFTGEPLDKDGNPTNKNVPFRLVADFGKAIKRSEFILIGEDVPFRVDDSATKYVTFETLYQITCSAAKTKQIAGRMHMGSHELRASTQLRDIMRREVGLPNAGESFKDFITRFRKEYNYNVRLLEVAKRTRFRADMRISRDFGWDGITEAKKIGKALLDIYGDVSVETMFPNITKLAYDIPEDKLRRRQTSGGVLSKYHSMSLNMFAMNNKLSVNMKEIEKRFSNGTWKEMDILLLVADRRTADTQSYKDTWDSWTEKCLDVLPDIQKSIKERDYNRYARDMIDLMDLASPDIFAYFGMNDFNSFINSEWGKKLLACEDVQSFRSTWVSMLIEYRLAKMMKLSNEKADVFDIEMSEDDRAKVIDTIDAMIDNEADSLRSSSFAWKTIVDEAREGNSNFKMLIDNAGSEYRMNGSAMVLNGARFWKDPNSRRYGTLYSFLMSDASYDDKINVLSDIVRIRENYKDIMSYEMIGQLAYHPNRTAEWSNFDMSSGLSTKPFKTSMDRISSYMANSPKRAREFADKLVSKANADKNGFERFVSQLAEDPGFLVHIDTYLAADVMASVADKDYSDTEKIKQQQRVNGYFQSVSKMRAGGFYTHMQQTDNKQLNVVGYDQLTPIDIIRIIGSPSETYYAYDEFGRMVKLSREAICGGNSIEDVITFIDRNPQMAYLFRRYSANINDDTGKGASAKGTASLRGIDNSFELYSRSGDPRSMEQRAFQELCDRPRFFALAALLTPVGHDTGRTLSDKYNDAVESMCNLLCYLAKFDGIETPQGIVAAFEQVTGLSEKKIMAATKVAKFDDGSGFDDNQAHLMYAEAIGEMQECVSLLSEKGIVNQEAYGSPHTFEWGIDDNSVTSYYDVRQQFSGSRTATMIGVEGSETQRNQMFKLYLNHRPDRFFTVGYNTSEADLMRLSQIMRRDLYEEVMTSGPVTIDRTEYEELADWIPSDQTLERGLSKQLQSGAKFIEIKRDSAAEEFNAKTKKFGDDGTNSVTKFDKFDYELADELRTAISGCETRDQAIWILAERLRKADIELGYKAFPMSDYLNKADIMIVEDESGLVVRTFEQLSAACRNRLSSEARYSGNSDLILAEIEQIVTVLGTSADEVQASESELVSDLLYNMQRFSSGGSFKADRAILEYASSTERNYSLLQKYYREFDRTYMTGGKKFVPPKRETIENMSFSAFKHLKASNPKAADKIRGLAFPYMRYDRKIHDRVENPHGDHSGIYDYLGKADDDDLLLLPGPQNIVLFDSFNKKVLDQCRQYGITAVFDGFENVPEELQMDAQELGDDLYIVPFFYMTLNGATGTQMGPAPAQYHYHPTNYTVCVEDVTGEISAGDATVHITKELGDRTQVTRGDVISVSAEELFPNVMETFSGSNYDYQVDFCTREEVKKYIIDQFDDATIDIGVPMSGNRNEFNREMQKMETRIAEYASRFDEANSVSFLTGDMKDDRIVGFVKIIVNGEIKAFAPVIPFRRGRNGKAIRNYSIASLGYDHASRSFQIAWRYDGDIRDQSVKFFEGFGSSNKMMTNGDYIKSRSLANGTPIDALYSTSSVASRLFASNKRINTMVSLMMIPRIDMKYAYNFADIDGAFDGDEELREALRNDAITKEMWFDMHDSEQVFHSDPEINAVVRFIVGRCKEYRTVNPTTILANKFANGQVKFLTTEFEAFMDTSLNFQDGLMKLMHMMQPSLCPYGIYGDSKSTLFKSNLGSGDQFGVLQMIVPHYFDDSPDPFYVAENVYISPGFFGDVFSGFGRFNVDAGLANEDLVVANGMSDEALIQYAAIGASELAPMDQMLMRGISID